MDKENSVAATQKYFSNGINAGQVNRTLYVDTRTWLPDDLLIKADKITMANSLELRVPLLDHKVLEFAASLPDSYKVRGFTTKYIAKRALKKVVPREISDRKKAGFPVPYESWLQKDLRDWLLDILFDRETLARGYFQRTCIENLVAENQRSGGRSKEIFSLAVLELWHRQFLKPALDPRITPTQTSQGIICLS